MRIKILLIVIISFFIISCSSSNKEYTITYEVYYSSNVVIKETKKSDRPFHTGCREGTSYVYNGLFFYTHLIETSAPIRVLSYTCKEIK